MMVHTGRGVAAEAQHEMFRRVREHARQANDRRPVKSPAESLLALLNAGGGTWEKLFHTEPEPVTARVLDAVEAQGQPCLLMVSRGMHWVVAFGRTRREDGSAAGVLLRDPAWAGMPRFFGLTTLPEKPTFQHTAQDPCTCLNADNPPGSVHERYMALEELLSPRGLQGSPDWEGHGALALVPAGASPAPAAASAGAAGDAGSKGAPGQPGGAQPDPGSAALQQTREHGLWGRADSPPEWQAVLNGATAGAPLLVKHPDDRRDDFYLVPLQGPNPAGRSAWVMLDVPTLRLREAALLDHWTPAAFPNEEDAARISEQDVTLPDGTRARFKKSQLRPNHRNLVWAASAASILPYWPVKEFTVPHPHTGEQVPVYVTQHGEVFGALAEEDAPETSDASDKSERPRAKFTVPVLCAAAGLAAGYAMAALQKPAPITTPAPLHQEIKQLQTALTKAEQTAADAQAAAGAAKNTAAELEKEIARLRSLEQRLQEEIRKLKSPRGIAPAPVEPAPAPPRPAEPANEAPSGPVRPAEAPPAASKR